MPESTSTSSSPSTPFPSQVHLPPLGSSSTYTSGSPQQRRCRKRWGQWRLDSACHLRVSQVRLSHCHYWEPTVVLSPKRIGVWRKCLLISRQPPKDFIASWMTHASIRWTILTRPWPASRSNKASCGGSRHGHGSRDRYAAWWPHCCCPSLFGSYSFSSGAC